MPPLSSPSSIGVLFFKAQSSLYCQTVCCRKDRRVFADSALSYAASPALLRWYVNTMSDRIRATIILSSALIAGLLILLGASWLARQAIYPAPGDQYGLWMQYHAGLGLAGPVKHQRVERRTSLQDAALSPQRATNYSLSLTGLLYIPLPGFYELGTASDDDSWLILDGVVLVDNHGEHPLQRRMAGVWLTPGPHLFRVEYWQRAGKAALQLWWRPFWSAEPKLIPPDALKPISKPLDHVAMLELGHAVRIRQAQTAAVLLTAFLMLVVGLWPPGGWRRVLALYLAAAPMALGSIVPQMGLDLWCDEIVSLSMFSIQPLKVTVSQYPFANNHIFYNLINNLFLRLIGCHDIDQAMTSPFTLRLLSLGFSLGAMAWLYRAVLRRFNFEEAWLAALVLATTLPVASFATQLRGYSFCLLLFIIMLDLLLRFLERPRALTGLGLAAASCALVWVLPTNVYLCAAVLLVVVPMARRPEKRWRVLSALLWAGGGMVLGALLYLPVREQVARQSSVLGLFSQAKILYQSLPAVWDHLFTGRYLLLPGMALGAWLLMKRKAPGGKAALAAAVLFILPFFLLWIYGTQPYQRVFLSLAIPLAAAAGLLLSAPLRAWSWGRVWRWVWLGMIFVICAGSYALSLAYWRGQVESADYTGHNVQNLSYGYYLHNFNPRQTLLIAMESGQCLPAGNMIMSLDISDGGTLFEYARYFRLGLSEDFDSARSRIKRGECLYVISRGRRNSPGPDLASSAPLTPLGSGGQYYRLYRWGPAKTKPGQVGPSAD
jgi:hypothetical protein